MGSSRVPTNYGSNPMRRSTESYTYTLPQPPEPEERTVSVRILQLDGTGRTSLYRDEIFDVEITVTGEPAYTGTMELELIADTLAEDLGDRENVQMYDFANLEANPNCAEDRSITSITFEEGDEGEKTFRAVVNIAQGIRIRATHVRTQDHDFDLSIETDNIQVVPRMRQYTIHHGNGTVNDYDGNINTWVNYWENWHLGDPAYTFMDGAIPPPELVKAVAYKESTLYTRDRMTNVENLNLMRITGGPLNDMKIQTPGRRPQYSVNAIGLGDPDETGLYTGTAANTRLMAYGTLNAGTVENGPTAATVDDSFQWGIRWLIAKYTWIDDFNAHTIRARGWWGENNGAVREYNSQNVVPNYATGVRGLYEEGRNPNEGDPDYLWPIKADGCPRQ